MLQGEFAVCCAALADEFCIRSARRTAVNLIAAAIRGIVAIWLAVLIQRFHLYQEIKLCIGKIRNIGFGNLFAHIDRIIRDGLQVKFDLAVGAACAAL